MVVREVHKAKPVCFTAGNRKSLLKHLKSLTKLKPSQQKSITGLEVHGAISTDSTETANSFINCFQENHHKLLWEIHRNHSIIRRFTKRKTINTFNNSKARDVFVLDAELLKTHSSTLIKSILCMINLSIRAVELVKADLNCFMMHTPSGSSTVSACPDFLTLILLCYCVGPGLTVSYTR